MQFYITAMKKIVSAMLLFAAIITTTVLASCGDSNDDPNDPSTESLTGSYLGNDALGIAFSGKDYSATAGGVKYTVSENKDGSLNVTFPEENFDFTGQGSPFNQIMQGSFVVKNIPFNAAKNAYYLDYSGTVRVDVTLNGKKANYEIASGVLTVTFNGSNVKLVNDYKYKGMPPALTMTSTFEGVKVLKE